jgi:UPF0755 protein
MPINNFFNNKLIRYSILKRIIIVLIVLTIILLIFNRRPVSTIEQEVLFVVESGQGVKTIALNLQQDGLIRNSTIFLWEVLISGQRQSLQAGTYLLSPHLSVSEIIKILSSGEIATNRITIIEGWRINQIADYLEEEGICSAEEFQQLAEGKEGYLFPDTYYLPLDASVKDIISLMENNFHRKIEFLEISKEQLSDIVIMASLIEKEVRTLEDKKIVSGIFWKRIKNNMPLQSCATIAYITGKNTSRISVAETKIPSPYNTYLNRGLPPAPISNPGLESIKASCQPVETEYWFYLSKPDGETVWSRNLDEHNKAKAKYLR